MILFALATLAGVAGMLAHAMRRDMADARANGRPILSLRDALRRHRSS